jgi:disulfide bond formation protein DsbB
MVGKLVILVALVLSVVAMLQPDRVTSGIVAGLVFTSILLTISAHGHHWRHGWHEAHRHHGIKGHANDHLDDYQRFVQVLSD